MSLIASWMKRRASLDRATEQRLIEQNRASVDADTDRRVQQVIRDSFHDCTVITIAHRLDTIIDYDQILCLEAGKLVELDSPLTLLDKKAGRFRAMCQDTGRFDELYEAASQASKA